MATTEYQLNRNSLSGVWAALTTPWGADGRLDERALRENISRLSRAGVDGVYTTDKDGEFYAIELDEFARLIEVFAEEAKRQKVATQVGVTWFHTAGVQARLRIAVEHGVLGAHIGHPPFMDMTPSALAAFWDDVAGCVPADFALVHYNSPRLANRLGADDYVHFRDRYPNFVGTKQTTTDFVEFARIVDRTPDLAHFAGDAALVPMMLAGARGMYSWLACFNAHYVIRWFRDCERRDWDSAMRRQRRVLQFQSLIDEVFGPHVRGGIVSKSVATASDFLVGEDRTRKPYVAAAAEQLNEFRRRTRLEFPDLLEGLPVPR